MKKKAKTLTIACLLIGLYTASTAQDYYGAPPPPPRHPAYNNNQQPQDIGTTEPSGYISINFGFATPEGNFGQSFPANTYSEGVGAGYGNYALPGSVFHFSFGLPVNHSNFGVAFMFGSYDNQYDINSYANTLNNSSVNYNPYSNSYITGYSGSQSNDYAETSIMGGLYATYPIGRLSIDGRLMIGALLNNLPEQTIYAEDADGDQLEYDVEPSNSTSFAFDIGAGARFFIAQFGRRKLCVMVNIDYLYSSVSYHTQQDLYVIPATGTNAGYQEQLVPSPTVSGTFPISLLNVSFGLGYQL